MAQAMYDCSTWDVEDELVVRVAARRRQEALEGFVRISEAF